MRQQHGSACAYCNWWQWNATASDFTARAEMLDGHQQQRQQQHQKVGQQQQQQQQPREPQHGPRLPVCDVSASGTAQQKEADGAAATVGVQSVLNDMVSGAT